MIWETVLMSMCIDESVHWADGFSFVVFYFVKVKIQNFLLFAQVYDAPQCLIMKHHKLLGFQQWWGWVQDNYQTLIIAAVYSMHTLHVYSVKNISGWPVVFAQMCSKRRSIIPEQCHILYLCICNGGQLMQSVQTNLSF